MIRLKLILFGVLLFSASPLTSFIYAPLYAINESNEVLKAWENWYYTMILSSIIVLLNLLRGFLIKEKIAIDVCLALVIGAIVDTLFFDINEYQLNDLLTITVALEVWLYNFFKSKCQK